MSRAAALLVTALVCAAALAEPDKDRLGAAEHYPVCTVARFYEPRCIVGSFSQMDQLYPARVVGRGEKLRPLVRAAKEPDIGYVHQGRQGDLDGYLAKIRTTGLLIAKGDTILVERYQYERNAAHRFTSFSMAKTVIGMLVGVAIAERQIRSVEDRAEQYVAELKGTSYGETTLRHLLNMSSGVKFREAYDGKDDVSMLVALSLTQQSEGGAATVLPFRERIRTQGEKFSYASAETQVLSLVLRAATGVPVAKYLSEKIWKPMGAEADASWIVDKGGYEVAFCCLNAILRDYARFGLLLADDGALEGTQIIPAEWVRAGTTVAAPHLAPGTAGRIFGYGYQTWVFAGRERRFALIGVRGQAIFVDPKSKIVMVHTGVAEDFRDPRIDELIALWNGVLERFGN